MGFGKKKMKAVITINTSDEEEEKDCQFVKWYVIRSLGNKKIAFCNAGKNGNLRNDSVPIPPHNQLCPHVAGKQCRFYKPKEESQ